jgi:hypothetical protein
MAVGHGRHGDGAPGGRAPITTRDKGRQKTKKQNKNKRKKKAKATQKKLAEKSET